MKRGSMRHSDFLNSLTEQAAGNVYKKNSVLGKKRITEAMVDPTGSSAEGLSGQEPADAQVNQAVPQPQANQTSGRWLDNPQEQRRLDEKYRSLFLIQRMS